MADDVALRTVADDVAEMQGLAGAPVVSEAELKANLGTIYKRLFLADLTRYDVAGQRKTAPQTMQSLFELRLGLRNQIANWEKRGFMSRDMQRALRDVFRVTRYACDMLGEMHVGYDKLPEGGKPRRGFTGADANVLVNPVYHTGADFAFLPGDVLLVRGQAHNSAAIARIGDIDSQFSHVGLVYADADGGLHKVEALIEAGSVVTPLEQALEHGLGRAAVSQLIVDSVVGGR